ncbi:MAG: transcriptional regulator [Clostridia bacterium]|nr:transcriptional regulator [Clostridia bacterium]
MNARNAAEEFFWMIVKCRKNLTEIPQNCSQGENGVLVYLTFFDKVSPSELSEKLNLSLPRIASILNSLENKKLVVKNLDNDDKRKSIVEITEEGRKLVDEKRKEAIGDITKVFENLNEEERKDYIRLTKKVLNSIECKLQNKDV